MSEGSPISRPPQIWLAPIRLAHPARRNRRWPACRLVRRSQVGAGRTVVATTHPVLVLLERIAPGPAAARLPTDPGVT